MYGLYFSNNDLGCKVSMTLVSFCHVKSSLGLNSFNYLFPNHPISTTFGWDDADITVIKCFFLMHLSSITVGYDFKNMFLVFLLLMDFWDFHYIICSPSHVTGTKIPFIEVLFLFQEYCILTSNNWRFVVFLFLFFLPLSILLMNVTFFIFDSYFKLYSRLCGRICE